MFGIILKSRLTKMSGFFCLFVWVFLGFFFYREWYRKRVKLVSAFLCDNGSIVSKSDFQKRFNFNTNIHCMKYNSIISAISKYVNDI